MSMAPVSAERKLVTALFADDVGSTSDNPFVLEEVIRVLIDQGASSAATTSGSSG